VTDEGGVVLEAESGEQRLGEHQGVDVIAVAGGEQVADHRSPVLAHHAVGRIARYRFWT
jgi:hypothetical protein